MDNKNVFLKFFYFISLIFIIIFGIVSIIASGGGGGDDDDTGSAPIISDLTYSPTSSVFGRGEETILITGSIEFLDNDGDVTSMTITTFDESGNQITTSTNPITGINGMKTGTIAVQFAFDTSVQGIGIYTFTIYISDAENLMSNNLTGDFSIKEDPWTIKTGLPTQREDMGATNLNGKIYVIGGKITGDYDLLGETLAYDVLTDTWETKSSMLTSRSRLSASASDEKVYAIGGISTGDPYPGYHAIDVVEEYDPEINNWTTKTPMTTARSWFASGVIDGKIYAIGGDADGAITNVVEEYDPAEDKWTTKASMHIGRSMLAVAVVNGKIYAIGGRNGNVNRNVVEEYDPAENKWTIKSPMPTARYLLAAAAVGGKIYAIGGTNDPYVYKIDDIVEEYDPATNTWTTKTLMPEGKYNFVAVSENNKIYVIGGWNSSTVLEYDPFKDQ